MKDGQAWTIRRRLLVAFLAVLIPSFLLAGASGLALWSIRRNTSGMYHEAVVEQQRLSDVEAAVDRLDAGATQYLVEGGPSARAGFERALAQLRERLMDLHPDLSDESDERGLIEAVRALGGQIEAVAREILRAPDAPADGKALSRLEGLRGRMHEASTLLNRAQAIGLQEMRAERDRVARAIGWTTAVGLGALALSVAGGIALALAFSGWLSRPILAIAERSRRMAEGDLSQRLEVLAGGELGEAAQAFNQMAERLETSTRENIRLYEEVLRQTEELEARVKERTAELEKALQVKVEFLRNMSHELRTPLNFVLGFTDLLKTGAGGPLTAKQEHYVEHIRTGARRLLELVTDLLDISQLEAGKTGLKLESIPLAPLVHGILDEVRVPTVQKRLTVTTVLPREVSSIVADRAKLTSILAHLVGNAVKFTPEGGTITVHARTVMGQLGDQATGPSERHEQSPVAQLPGRPGAEAIEIAVADTGIGIPPNDLERVFAPFHQVDGSDTRAYGGAGLGLALVRKLVELHGGWVWAESEGVGKGARFVVRLPRLEVPPPKRVLVVEDDPVFRDFLQAILKGGAYAVERAETGAQALAAIEATPPDLLVLDLGLPDMDGWAILERVRARERTRHLPVLILTWLAEISLEQARARGADDALTKPVPPQVLLETVARLVEGRMPRPEKS